ncbi:MAG: 30S ribosome-binding factor RbfA [Pseudomonadota bacterium]|nr:30S ribosome-binding factor RbfA [Pseudomonadota bacterium]
MTKLHDLFSGKGSSGQRHLRVGEEIRHMLSDVFMRGESNAPGLHGASITVSEVRVSPDLKNATAYVMPLGGENKEELLAALKEAAPEIRYLISKRVKLRHTPRIHFALDTSFDEAARIDRLLKKPEVARDLEKNDE